MTRPAEPDPLVEVLGEIRDELRKICDAVQQKPVAVRPAAAPVQIRSGPRPQIPRDHIG